MTLRLPTFFLTCLLLVAASGAMLSGWRQVELQRLPPPLSQTHPLDAFAARLDAVSDPVELRRLALARHHSLLKSDHTAHAVFATVATLNRAALIENLAIVGLGIGIYLFELRARGGSR